VARYAGDEFVVLLDQVSGPAAAEPIRQNIEAELNRPLQTLGIAPGGFEGLGAAVGLALHPGDGDDAEALIRHADKDMYERKRAAQANAAPR
jgi:GGDEF domain-containing protein